MSNASIQLLHEVRSHHAIDEVRAFNERLKGEKLSHERLRVFLSSLLSFNRHVAAGIAVLSGRLVDELIESSPFEAHKLASMLLRSASDEFGLGGKYTHAELFAQFSEELGVQRNEIHNNKYSVPASRDLGESLFSWYRTDSVAFGLGVHLASEVTSGEEFDGWDTVFFENGYFLEKNSQGGKYITVHTKIEHEHAEEISQLLALYLGMYPLNSEAVVDGARSYLQKYQQMFSSLNKTVFSTSC